MKKLQIIDNKLKCHICGLIKEINAFYIYNNAPKRPCIECKNNYQSNYYIENTSEIEGYKKEYYCKNKENIIDKQSQRDLLRKDEIAIYQKEYRKTHKDIRTKYVNYNLDPIFKIRKLVSNAIYQALRFNNATKDNSIVNKLDYSIVELKQHLESLFEPWMTWNNWKCYNPDTWKDNDTSTWVWNIDHIIPQAKLPYASMDDDNFKICWALTNLRPYSAKQNIMDSTRDFI